MTTLPHLLEFLGIFLIFICLNAKNEWLNWLWL
jgi:hypothetical protein